MEIQTLGREEIGVIERLWEGLRDHHRRRSTDFRPQFQHLTFPQRMAALTSRERFVLFVARNGDRKPVGYCAATVHGGSGEVDSLFVHPEERGRGLGERLLTTALDWLDEQACETVRILVAAGNEEVIAFYGRYAFAPRFTVLERKPEGRGGKRT
jgi:ribosomal protein S18 acetylase RimI-like enzyme